MINQLHRRRNANELEDSTIHINNGSNSSTTSGIVSNRTENTTRQKASTKSILLKLVPRTLLFVFLLFFVLDSMVDLLRQQQSRKNTTRNENLNKNLNNVEPSSSQLWQKAQDSTSGKVTDYGRTAPHPVRKEDVANERKQQQERIIKDDEKNQQQHKHIIPNNVIFTHYKNLLTTDSADLQEDSEDVSLQRNVRNTIALHPTATVHFYTDEGCIEAIKEAMGNEQTPLVSYFQQEPKGMYKADICRGAVLYNLGGLYFDIDIQPRMNIFSVLQPLSTEFVTSIVHKDSNWKGSFFQAFIGVTKRHPIMKRYLDLFVQHYNGTRPVRKGPLGVILLRQAYDDDQPNYNNTTVLWEEVRYNKDRFPDVPPTIGARRACHFVVAIPGTSIAPLYSRVRGSRMCGGKDS